MGCVASLLLSSGIKCARALLVNSWHSVFFPLLFHIFCAGSCLVASRLWLSWLPVCCVISCHSSFKGCITCSFKAQFKAPYKLLPAKCTYGGLCKKGLGKRDFPPSLRSSLSFSLSGGLCSSVRGGGSVVCMLQFLCLVQIFRTCSMYVPYGGAMYVAGVLCWTCAVGDCRRN